LIMVGIMPIDPFLLSSESGTWDRSVEQTRSHDRF
jgi:hypothetical protein